MMKSIRYMWVQWYNISAIFSLVLHTDMVPSYNVATHFEWLWTTSAYYEGLMAAERAKVNSINLLIDTSHKWSKKSMCIVIMFTKQVKFDKQLRTTKRICGKESQRIRQIIAFARRSISAYQKCFLWLVFHMVLYILHPWESKR